MHKIVVRSRAGGPLQMQALQFRSGEDLAPCQPLMMYYLHQAHQANCQASRVSKLLGFQTKMSLSGIQFIITTQRLSQRALEYGFDLRQARALTWPFRDDDDLLLPSLAILKQAK